MRSAAAWYISFMPPFEEKQLTLRVSGSPTQLNKAARSWRVRLQALVRRAIEVTDYFEYLPRHLKELFSFNSGLFRIFTQYSSRTSSSISTTFAYSESRPSFLGPEIQYCAPLSTSAKLALNPVPFNDANSRPR